MFRFTVLASGSKANATVIESHGYRILIDCGLSLRELSKRLAINGLRVEDLDALLITHLHSDHIKGVPSILEKVSLDVFVRSGFSTGSSRNRFNKLHAYTEFAIGPFVITPIPLPHDDGGSFGFIISCNGQNLVFATDLGFPTMELASALKSADALVIESNHDLEMLAQSAYPYFIKERIRSSEGHLSNCQSANLLQTSLSKQCQHVVLAHLSERANHPFRALSLMRQTITNSVQVASQSTPTAWFEIKAELLQQVAV